MFSVKQESHDVFRARFDAQWVKMETRNAQQEEVKLEQEKKELGKEKKKAHFAHTCDPHYFSLFPSATL